MTHTLTAPFHWKAPQSSTTPCPKTELLPYPCSTTHTHTYTCTYTHTHIYTQTHNWTVLVMVWRHTGAGTVFFPCLVWTCHCINSTPTRLDIRPESTSVRPSRLSACLLGIPQSSTGTGKSLELNIGGPYSVQAQRRSLLMDYFSGADEIVLFCF